MCLCVAKVKVKVMQTYNRFYRTFLNYVLRNLRSEKSEALNIFNFNLMDDIKFIQK